MNKVSGFTLIELVVTIAIVVILMAIADPSYKYITSSNRIAAEVNGLLGDLQFARSEAIKEGRTITACVSSDGTTCINSNAWQKGWIVFYDADGNGAINNSEVALRVQKPFTGSDSFAAANAVSVIQFNREGFASGITNGTVVTLHDATSNSKWTRCLSVNLSGLLAIQKVNGGTCS